MARVNSPFVSQANGFHFINRFDTLPDLDLPIVGPIVLKNMVLGLCGGMSFAALDYLNHHTPVPPDTDVEKISPLLRNYLYKRQLDSLTLFVLHRVVTWMLQDDDDVLHFTAREVPRLRALLDGGQPAVLCLVRVQGLNDPTVNHQVVVSAYDYDSSSQKLSLFLYDPNHPGLEPVISLSLANPNLAAGLAQSTGEPLRAFFVNPYSPSAPPGL